MFPRARRSPRARADRIHELPKLEYAKTGRSTCRRCGEAIAAGDLRVGIEAFVAGRVADTWQHPRCALEACYLERCSANRGKCKATDETFKKGDIRLAVCSKDHKTYYSVKGMGDALKPTLEAVGDFSPATSPASRRSSPRTSVPPSPPHWAWKSVAESARRSSRGASVAEVRVASAEKNDEGGSRRRRRRGEGGGNAVSFHSRVPPRVQRSRRRRQPSACRREPRETLPRHARGARGRHGRVDGLRARARGTHRAQQGTYGGAQHRPARGGGGAGQVRQRPHPGGIGAKRTRAPKEDVGPPRRSGRVAKLALDPALAAGVDYERRDGPVMLMNGTSTGWRYGEQEDKGPSPRGRRQARVCQRDGERGRGVHRFPSRFPRRPNGGSEIVQVREDAHGGGVLNATVAGARTGKAPVPTSASSLAAAKLSLTDEAVAKVVPRGVTHLDIAPYDPAGPVVVAAGDKRRRGSVESGRKRDPRRR